MSLPLLKSLILILRDISFQDEELTNRLFSSFPYLESLIVKVSHNPFPEINLNVSLPKLKYFEFDSRVYYDSSGEVKLHAPSLSSFIFRSYMSTNFTLTNLSSLATADIKMRCMRIRSQVPEICARALGLLRGIHNVEVLTLNHNFLEAFGGAPDILQTQPTEHFNIQHLKLQTYLSRNCLRSIFFILNNSPNAESISCRYHR
ncbi:uncharacterized protein LOC113319168 [Papaver somniferum]|uniref:uncharacterized protein LOC113319168 n=1 Tax=Papaver somniferum TaxID=3469 RepID=UPI000E70107A|nr:uncharacterized protein LOC113319168 [Papaver somniferum]